MRRHYRLVCLGFSLLVLSGCFSTPPTGPLDIGEGTPILFIGNSHALNHDLPGLLQALADSAGEKIAVRTVAFEGVALIDHWNAGPAVDEIRSREWSFVVLQQGWTPAGVCRDTLRLVSKRFNDIITAGGGTAALFQTWPAADRPTQWQGTIESYRLAAEDVHGLLFPLAEAWREATRRDPDIQLFADGIHANATGTYLNVLVMYARLFNRSTMGSPHALRSRTGVAISIPPDVGQLLQAVADSIGLVATPAEPPVARPVITSRC